MRIKGIGWAGTKTDRFEETVRFFRDILNLPVRVAEDELSVFELPNGDLFEVIGPSLAPELANLRGPKVDFLVQDIDHAVIELKAKGIVFVGDVFRDEVQSWANFYAPDGNIYGITDIKAHPLQQANRILFYGPHQANAFLSNWYPASLYLKEKIWPSSEHYYQAQKMAGTEYEETCRRLGSPREAFEMTRRPDIPVREDWDEVKVDVMRDAVTAKFQQNPELLEQLLATGDAELVENSPVDYFWGAGKNGIGQNVLGRILMDVRAKLRAEQDE